MSKLKINDIAYYNRKTVLNNLKKGSVSSKLEAAYEMKEYVKTFICPVIEAIATKPEDCDENSRMVLSAMKEGILHDIIRDILRAKEDTELAKSCTDIEKDTPSEVVSAEYRGTEDNSPIYTVGIPASTPDAKPSTDVDINTIL